MVPPTRTLCSSKISSDGKKLRSVTKEVLDLDEEDDKENRGAQGRVEPLAKLVKEVPDDKVKKVVVSSRLAVAPCVFVTAKYSWSANMDASFDKAPEEIARQ